MANHGKYLLLDDVRRVALWLSMGANSVHEGVSKICVRGLHQRAVSRAESFTRRVKAKGG
jgi:hypothetical protein